MLQQLVDRVQALRTTWCPILLLKLVLWAQVTTPVVARGMLVGGTMCRLQCTLLQWVRPESILDGTTTQQVFSEHLTRG